MRLSFEVPEKKRVRVILDTDTACEADDPYAIAYALLSPKLKVRAIIAEHFRQPGSMEQSYQAIGRLTRAMAMDALTLRGEEWPSAPGREPSEGVRAIIAEALREDAAPLFVLCMGALTNMAAALTLAPEIASRLTVVTIGGRGYEAGSRAFREFNFGNDVDAANRVLGSDAPVWQIPATVYSTVRVGLAELQRKVYPCGEAGKYLFEQMIAYNGTDRAGWTSGESWSLGDSPSVAVALHPDCGKYADRIALRVNEDTSYSREPLRADRQIRVYESVDARYLLEDFFAKLDLAYGDDA